MKERINRFLDTPVPYARLALPCAIVVLGAVLWFFWPYFGYPMTVNGLQDGDTLCGDTSAEILVPRDGPDEPGRDVRLFIDGKFVKFEWTDPMLVDDGPWPDGQTDIQYDFNTTLFPNGPHTVTVTYGWRNERYHVFFQNPVPKRAQKG